LLPLGEAGLRSMAPEHEARVIGTLRDAMHERAIYFFPGIDMRTATDPELAAWEQKVQAGPTGIVVYNPGAGATLSPRLLGTELFLNLLEGLIAATIAAHFTRSAGYLRRALLIAGISLAAALAIDGSFWNWYAFPTSFFLAQLTGGALGGLFAGLVIARIVPPV
jgi:hypothetical protein